MSATTKMTAEMHGLRTRVQELARVVQTLQQEIDEIKLKAEGDEQQQQPEPPEPESAPEPARIDLSPLRPFDIQYDWAAKTWKIYLPEGSVMVGDEIASYDGGTNSDKMADITPATTLYAHVRGLSGPEGNYSFTIDDDPGGGDSICSFKVASFDSRQREVTVQYVSGVVTVGGNAYVCGVDSNISFRMCEDENDIDHFGRTMVDVYYV